MPRIAGIDLARALAIGGMFVAHLARDDWAWAIRLAAGRSSALFALLAGCGLGFMTMRAYPNAVSAHYRRVLLRAAYLGVLGVALMFLGTPVVVILSSYALMFALTVPFLGAPPRLVFASAAVVVAVAPPVVQALRLALTGSPEHSSMWIPGVFELATGYYPALSWLAYSLVGLGLVRLDLQRTRTQLSVVLAGVAASLIGYGGGWALTHVLDVPEGQITYLSSLVGVKPHTDSGFEILGNIGASLIVIGLSLLVTRANWQRLFLSPLTAAGSMSLTLYVGHLFYIWALGPAAVWYPTSQQPLLWLIGGSIVFAFWWRLFFGRGPLEQLLARLTDHARPSPVP